MTFLHVVGARPQFMKLAPLHKEMISQDLECKILHTGQHFDSNMSDIFFKELDIPKPDYNLNINSLSNVSMTAKMMEGIEEIIVRDDIDAVIVYGDTNSTTAGAIVARQMNIPVIHVESGVRNGDPTMPEEINRIVVDRIADLLFCVSERSYENLKQEALWYGARAFNCGDLMYDCLLNTMKLLDIPDNNVVEPYVLATIHRAYNTDNPARLRSIIGALNTINEKTKVVMPMHPRTKNKIEGLQIDFDLSPPVGYKEMMGLLANSRSVITDSGGLVREAYWLKKPSLTLLRKPVWSELISLGVSQNVDPSSLVGAYRERQLMVNEFTEGIFGFGDSAKKITHILLDNIKQWRK